MYILISLLSTKEIAILHLVESIDMEVVEIFCAKEVNKKLKKLEKTGRVVRLIEKLFNGCGLLKSRWDIEGLTFLK
jgi:hypothetical protein